MTNTKHSRSELWRHRWNDAAKHENPFATMGRSSDTISTYFAYLNDLQNGLGGVDKNTTLLDAAGGCGYLSMYFSTLVKDVYLFDYSEAAIKRAAHDCQPFENIHPYVDNLLTLENTKQQSHLFEKILVGGALQYFDDYQEIKRILVNLYQISAPNCRTFISQTPDMTKKQQHIASYDRLDWPQEKKQKAITEELANRFWVNFDEIKCIADQIGFSECQQTTNNPILFQSSHMFDFYLVK